MLNFAVRSIRLGKLGYSRPNRLHHLFIRDYIAAYPEARAYAVPDLPQKRPDLRFDDALSVNAQEEWPGQVDQHLFRSAPVVFFHPTTQTLIPTDLAFNIPLETAKNDLCSICSGMSDTLDRIDSCAAEEFEIGRLPGNRSREYCAGTSTA